MAHFSTVSDADIDAIAENKNSPSTKKATETLFNVLLSYCKEKCINICVKKIPKQELYTILVMGTKVWFNGMGWGVVVLARGGGE